MLNLMQAGCETRTLAHEGQTAAQPDLIDKPSFRRHAAGTSREVEQGLHASPRSAPSKGAKLCTYHRWFARISPVPEPYNARSRAARKL